MLVKDTSTLSIRDSLTAAGCGGVPCVLCGSPDYDETSYGPTVSYARPVVPLSFELMVAAVAYCGATDEELSTPAQVRHQIDLFIGFRGIDAAQRFVERAGTAGWDADEAAGWAFSRQAVAAMLTAERAAAGAR
ncbi:MULTISPECIES: hypothetical protein [Protofrankia]|uniref:Uncharacterized protein n=1 Tax=Candidatus Protofrankia datiscae TaxID=2716812 RepID=F8B2I6_9ACTN|nr:MULTISPECIES: hypothetical protein [Protofrankia]AEH08450.1 hypothetical protein FsymDg_0944 [Candidatus Protofrankia datiscae]